MLPQRGVGTPHLDPSLNLCYLINIMRNIEGSIITYTGRLFWPLDPRLEDINLLDICHALSQKNRFTGHTIIPYSVAEHSCRVSDLLPKELKLTGLLHDGAEAFLTDLAKPVKEQKEMKFFKEAEDKLMYYIAIKFGLSYPFDEQIKIADKILLNTEYRDLMTKNKLRENDFNGSKPLEERIVPWTSQVAKFGMIDRLEKLGIEVTR